MGFEKKLLKKSAGALLKGAEDALEIAKNQHSLANNQHANAEKLVVLAEGLEADAIEISGETDIATNRSSPPLIEREG